MRALAWGLVVGLGCWLGLLVWAPAAIASGRRPAMIPAIAAYSAGSLVCHQQARRSFLIAGRQMPVCARCTGLYGSAFAGGLIALAGARRRLRGGAHLALILGAAPTAASWALEYAGVIHTSNLARALLAIPLGLAAGWIVITLCREPSA